MNSLHERRKHRLTSRSMQSLVKQGGHDLLPLRFPNILWNDTTVLIDRFIVHNSFPWRLLVERDQVSLLKHQLFSDVRRGLGGGHVYMVSLIIPTQLLLKAELG